MTARTNVQVLLIGCGNMGYALAVGWLTGAEAIEVHIVEPSAPLRERAAAAGAATSAELGDVSARPTPDVVLLAVKPQQMDTVLPDIRRFAESSALVISVAAGVGLERMEEALGTRTSLIRCMPNTPAAIGAGMMVCVANGQASPDQRALAQRLLSATGQVRFVQDEALMDAVTAVSGSGPAYVFHMIDCLERAGIAEGLPGDLARELALQTVYGAGRLAREGDTDPATLRRQVTSPNGTTAAALAELMGPAGVDPVIARAVHAARRRSVELGGS
ncbi:pyrroline-5-carboxylate reductase [Ancylobacter rudongensis]|uniref:Pyrroline-5-carboxylate reductase n=1 Tax=Ancylobacter rudongensis TaxID=177413 RepID=A0A1G4SD86_9HYPH|nr:pyrroline-5-carboxylate reductase [Ancylobacter rudongensis]SCW67153.1 pyrroline-5-carboxylate reductase [Ancylobacter rudongensis]